MGEKKLKIADVNRATGIHRGTLTRLYHDKAVRIELEILDKLCRYLKCEVCELLELTEEP
tara:strand:- start:15804 stop:15983 length:180 start_codon:yes stop_codon:yes gene_type:complete